MFYNLAILLAAVLILAAGVTAWVGSGQMIHPPRRRPELKPSDLDLPSESIEFRASDGCTLRGWFIPAPQAKGAIIFSHGYAGERSPDLIYAPTFHRAGYDLLFFDYRGHGASDGCFTSLVYFERRDLLAALDFLKQRGITRAGILGFSMGGAVALAAAPHRAMVVAVATDCTFAELQIIMGNAVRARGAPPFLASLIGWLMVCFASLRLRANLFSANPIRWVDKIAPRSLLLMHAQEDESVPVEQAYRLFERAREPKELWIVPHAKHRKIEDVAREEYRERIVRFFDDAFERASREPRTRVPIQG